MTMKEWYDKQLSQQARAALDAAYTNTEHANDPRVVADWRKTFEELPKESYVGKICLHILDAAHILIQRTAGTVPDNEYAINNAAIMNVALEACYIHLFG